jgi:hypothetical protein
VTVVGCGFGIVDAREDRADGDVDGDGDGGATMREWVRAPGFGAFGVLLVVAVGPLTSADVPSAGTSPAGNAMSLLRPPSVPFPGCFGSGARSPKCTTGNDTGASNPIMRSAIYKPRIARATRATTRTCVRRRPESSTKTAAAGTAGSRGAKAGDDMSSTSSAGTPTACTSVQKAGGGRATTPP